MATTIGHSIERAGFRRRRPLSTAHVLSRECFQAICQRRVALPVRHSFDGEPDGPRWPHQDCELLGARQARVEQIPAEQQVVLHEEREDHLLKVN